MTRLMAVALAGCMVLASGCAKNLVCGPGTTLEGKLCVPEKADGGAGDGGTVTDAGSADGGSCKPSCFERECGDDGCGGSCGACADPAKPTCDKAIGRCEAQCVPDCSGKTCGDDGCGGSCGTCQSGSVCEAWGKCVPQAWTCDPHWYAAGDTCDCGCGAPDPDCQDPSAPVSGCTSTEKCASDGTCQPKVPAAWTCAPTSYDARDKCDCNCGAPDPDCAFSSLPVVGCPGASPTCNADGTCAQCVPDCTGKVCGPDGCGGTCGTCTDTALSACVGGACVSPCNPKPLICETDDCGDDGCGGSCGTCQTGWSCQAGNCVKDPAPDDPQSCVGHCGSDAPAGCGCSPGCKADGTCCSDYQTACACRPDCTGKQCGPDGCGGTCGTCSGSTPYCDADQQCLAQCQPKCDGAQCGDDGCGGSCGTCAAGSSCSWNRQCVPDTWRCDPGTYGAKDGCDCGCGAPDPDCGVSGTYTIGCPSSTTACTSQGLCDVQFCSSNTACAPKWCTGVYWAGNGKDEGVCADPVSDAKATGQPCSWNGECASGVCAGDQCRIYCEKDSDCPGSEKCLGVPMRDTPTGPITGFVAVCDLLSGSGTPCSSQVGCPGEVCVAYPDPTDLEPLYLCDSGTTANLGTDCSLLTCPAGQTCVDTSKGPECTIDCPGGAADCPAGFHCGSTTFHNNGTPETSDDPTVAVCLPN